MPFKKMGPKLPNQEKDSGKYIFAKYSRELKSLLCTSIKNCALPKKTIQVEVICVIPGEMARRGYNSPCFTLLAWAIVDSWRQSFPESGN